MKQTHTMFVDKNLDEIKQPAVGVLPVVKKSMINGKSPKLKAPSLLRSDQIKSTHSYFTSISTIDLFGSYMPPPMAEICPAHRHYLVSAIALEPKQNRLT